LARAWGNTIKSAQQLAAQKALEILKTEEAQQ
jgi:dsRNA-specific ribonuclease